MATTVVVGINNTSPEVALLLLPSVSEDDVYVYVIVCGGDLAYARSDGARDHYRTK